MGKEEALLDMTGRKGPYEEVTNSKAGRGPVPGDCEQGK